MMMELIKKTTALLLITIITLSLSFFIVGPNNKAYAIDAKQYFDGVTGGSGGSSVSGAVSNFGNCVASSILGGSLQNALSGIFGGIAGDILTTLSVRTVDQKLGPKEVGTGIAAPSWDAISFCVTNATVAFVTQGVVNYLNEGVGGNPAFVDDLSQFLLDTAGIVAEDFISEIGSAGIYCDAFGSDIQIALTNDFARDYTPNGYINSNRCIVNSQVSDVEGFINGNADGGWEAFRILAIDDNPYIQYWEARRQLDKNIASAKAVAEEELAWGSGVAPAVDTDGKTKVPGKIILDYAGKALGLPLERIIQADEFDEVLSILVDKLVKTALNEILAEINI